MRIGSLCSGYEGLGMAVQTLIPDAELAWVSDVDKGANKILAHRYPDVPNLGDFTVMDWSTVEPIDVLTAGYPCQPFSHAGKRAGTNDARHLWPEVLRCLTELRPPFALFENVRGHLSLGFDQVLADLATHDYDARWIVLRAADIGAPHGRARLFILAADARRGGDRWDLVGAGRGAVRVGGVRGEDPERGDAEGRADLLGGRPMPTPRASDGEKGGPNQRGSSGDLMLPSAVAQLLPTPTTTQRGTDANLDTREGARANLHNEVAKMLPTPTSRDWKDHTIRREPHRPDDTDTLARALTDVPCALLPTPAVNDMGAAYTPETWDAWTEKMKAEHGNGNGHGKSLSIEAQRLLPTPTSADSKASGGSTPSDVTLTDAVVRTNLGEQENPRHASAPEGRPGQVLRDVRGADVPQEVRGEARGSDALPVEEELLTGVREHEGRRGDGHAPLAGAEAQGADLPGLRDDEEPARSPRGQESGEQRPGESDDALRELSPEAALARGSGEAARVESLVAWGPYEPAIRRWELILGRPAPMPTQMSAKGNPQLSPRFVEFLMGLPEGWVDDVPGLTRSEKLKALGNGVVSQQAIEAVLRLLALGEVAA